MTLHLTKEFLEAIQEDPSRCVLLVGAGLSTSGVRKGGKGLPDWDTLIKHMIEDLKDSEKCGPEALSNLEKWLKDKKYLEIAEKFKNKKRPDQFAAFLKRELNPPDLDSSEIHRSFLEQTFEVLLRPISIVYLSIKTIGCILWFIPIVLMTFLLSKNPSFLRKSMDVFKILLIFIETLS